MDARSIRADRGDDRTRLDHVLARHLADRRDVSRSLLQRLIRSGRVRLNGQAATRPAARLAPGDRLEVELPAPPPPPPAPEPQPLPLSVLYEDEHLLAVDKPAEQVVHPAPGHRDGTLLNALLWLARGWPEGAAPHLVQRLDLGTSGLLLVAKTPEMHAALVRSLAAPDAAKEYLAVTYGAPAAAKGRIDLPIGLDPADRRRRRVDAAGKPAATRYERLATGSGPGERLALLACRLETGRTHQVRVHLSARGLPLVGDPLYGAPRWHGLADPELARCCRELPRQALHAWRLVFGHPVSRRRVELTAPLPADLSSLLGSAGVAAPPVHPPPS